MFLEVLQMNEFALILISTFIVAILAWIGIFTLFIREKTFRKILHFFVSFAAGTLIGGAFLHLIPESFHGLNHGHHGSMAASLIILFGIVFFFGLEKILKWHHCHKMPDEHRKEAFSYLILISDGIHNLVDGMIIGASFLTDISLGIVTTIAVAAHEIPQELGNFGILVKGGWKKFKALVVNFIAALLIVPGGVMVYYMRDLLNPYYLVAFAAGGFVYIGAADLIPELKPDQETVKNSILTMLFFVLGIFVMVLVEIYVPHAH